MTLIYSSNMVLIVAAFILVQLACPGAAQAPTPSPTPQQSACQSGYTGTGVACIDIDECSTNTDNCDAHAICTNTIGSFDCSCKAGYTGTGVACIDIDECSTNIDNCNAHAICTNTIGSFDCSCKAGYYGDGVVCTNIDDCASSPCKNMAHCVDYIASFVCHCPPDHFGVTCDETHADCSGNVSELCGYGSCVNEVRTEANTSKYSCTCDPGYTKPAGEQECTVDIDECSLLTHNCTTNAACSNTVGSFTCACQSGYTGTGVDCEAPQQRPQPALYPIFDRNVLEKVLKLNFTGSVKAQIRNEIRTMSKRTTNDNKTVANGMTIEEDQKVQFIQAAFKTKSEKFVMNKTLIVFDVPDYGTGVLLISEIDTEKYNIYIAAETGDSLMLRNGNISVDMIFYDEAIGVNGINYTLGEYIMIDSFTKFWILGFGSVFGQFITTKNEASDCRFKVDQNSTDVFRYMKGRCQKSHITNRKLWEEHDDCDSWDSDSEVRSQDGAWALKDSSVTFISTDQNLQFSWPCFCACN